MFDSRTMLTSFLDNAAQSWPDKLALRDAHHSLSFQQTRHAALALAKKLQDHGVKPQDRVVLFMANSVAMSTAFWAVLYSGAIAVPLSPETKPAKLGWIMGNCTARLIVSDSALEPNVREALSFYEHDIPVLLNSDGKAGLAALSGFEIEMNSPTDLPNLEAGVGAIIDQDLAAIIYTSGSTGEPKGVMLSHLNMTSAARSVSHYLGYQQQDSIFCCIPMTFDYGLHQLTMACLTGASLLVEPSFAQPFFVLHRLSQSGATVFPIVPTMVPLIEPLADRFDLSSVRLLSSTSAALHADVIDRLAKLFPQSRIFSMYGLTECHRCTYLEPEQLATRKSSVGRAIPNTQMWVVDDEGNRHFANATGELVIRGSTVMKGYWNNPTQTDKKLRAGPNPDERVLYTGDICRLDEEGYLYFVGRMDDILKVRGEKVAPSEIEAVLIHHPDVAEVAVIGQSHPVHGDQAVACVTLREGSTTDRRDLQSYCASYLEPHVVPGRIEIMATMIRNQNGKIDKNHLKATLARLDAQKHGGTPDEAKPAKTSPSQDRATPPDAVIAAQANAHPTQPDLR